MASAKDQVCPFHGTPMYYSSSEDRYACQDVKCVTATGATGATLHLMRTGFIVCLVCQHWHTDKYFRRTVETCKPAWSLSDLIYEQRITPL
jgi:hypothetical protein